MMVEEVEDFAHIGHTLLVVQQKGHASVPEAATILKLHTHTVRAHMRAGKISSTRVGNREVILLDELQRYVQLVEEGTLHDADQNPPTQNIGRVKGKPPPDTSKFDL